jgi:hypothetical protein
MEQLIEWLKRSGAEIPKNLKIVDFGTEDELTHRWWESWPFPRWPMVR